MVDRIVSHRKNNELVPRAEPLPRKALVIEDLNKVLPEKLRTSTATGVILCHDPDELTIYISLKLLIANATFTCMVYSMVIKKRDNIKNASKKTNPSPQKWKTPNKLKVYPQF